MVKIKFYKLYLVFNSNSAISDVWHSHIIHHLLQTTSYHIYWHTPTLMPISEESILFRRVTMNHIAESLSSEVTGCDNTSHNFRHC